MKDKYLSKHMSSGSRKPEEGADGACAHHSGSTDPYGMALEGHEAWVIRLPGDPLLQALSFQGNHPQIDRSRVPEAFLADPIANALLANYARITQADWEMADPVSTVGPELDGFANRPDPANWGLLWHLNFAAMGAIKPRRKLAALLMARDEALHLSEWFAHAAAIGIEHVFVYTNDNSDGTDRLLDWFARRGQATIIRMSTAPGTNVQIKNYEHALHLLPEMRLYQWIAVLDADEFLVPVRHYGHDLQQLLAAAEAKYPARPPAAILFPWLTRLWEPHFERRPGLLTELYRHGIPIAGFKPVVRLFDVLSLVHVHIPTVQEQAFVVDSALDVVDADAVWTQSHKSLAGGRIDHFWARSFEEFLIKKRRGDTLAIRTGDNPFAREYEVYFAWTAEQRPENLAPMPPALIAAQRQMLSGYNADKEYRRLIKDVELWYQNHSAALRNDLQIRSLYESLCSSVKPSLLAAPATRQF